MVDFRTPQRFGGIRDHTMTPATSVATQPSAHRRPPRLFLLLRMGSDRPSTSASHFSTSIRRYNVRVPTLIVLGT